jgi:DNA-binding response OmpR family regulator
VHGIVRQHGGYISVESTPGSGTSFRMRFPATEKGASTSGREHRKQAAPGTARILVVEDEPTVREGVCRILRANGYVVHSAGDAQSCLELIDRQLPCFDLLITHVIMPKTNGKELHRRLAKRIPGVKLLYMSGCPEDVIASQGILDDGTNFIQKPVSVRSLVPKVQQVLGA